MHGDPAWQARPQAPQWAALARVSTSQPLLGLLSQSPKLVAQTAPQTPAAQKVVALGPAGHAVPQAPQWSGSLARLVQVPAQLRCPVWQLTPHWPAEHTVPLGQTVPQAPQLVLLVLVLTSQPLAASPSQSAKPAAQAASVQAPALQRVVALGSAQARPHPPQWAALVAVSVSQPLAAWLSQSPKPVERRTIAQAPAVQPWVAVLARAQAAPHAPQWAGSMAVLAQKLVGAAPQVVAGAAQVVPHTPPEHT